VDHVGTRVRVRPRFYQVAGLGVVGQSLLVQVVLRKGVEALVVFFVGCLV